MKKNRKKKQPMRQPAKTTKAKIEQKINREKCDNERKRQGKCKDSK